MTDDDDDIYESIQGDITAIERGSFGDWFRRALGKLPDGFHARTEITDVSGQEHQLADDELAEVELEDAARFRITTKKGAVITVTGAALFAACTLWRIKKRR